MDIDEPVPYVESTQQAGPSSGFAQIPEGPMGPGDMPDQEPDHLDPYNFTYVEGESSTHGKVSNQLPLIYLSSSSVHRSGSSGKPNSFSNFPRTSTVMDFIFLLFVFVFSWAHRPVVISLFFLSFSSDLDLLSRSAYLLSCHWYDSPSTVVLGFTQHDS